MNWNIFLSYCDGLMCSNHEGWVAWTITFTAKLWVSIVLSQFRKNRFHRKIKATLTLPLFILQVHFYKIVSIVSNSQTCCRWKDLQKHLYTFSFFDRNSLCSLFLFVESWKNWTITEWGKMKENSYITSTYVCFWANSETTLCFF